ncbi:27890_t:CDS:2 [Dentiscutata erythropus]|uniref:27890_t:CDS:1 n=1 Tax=Dentiscutata erythropus TaxID=1348616 RepID=A0A9N8WLS8_9GLOM|nr:27890_t:CDS:2 [Dentiscutata erythropus]
MWVSDKRINACQNDANNNKKGYKKDIFDNPKMTDDSEDLIRETCHDNRVHDLGYCYQTEIKKEKNNHEIFVKHPGGKETVMKHDTGGTEVQCLQNPDEGDDSKAQNFDEHMDLENCVQDKPGDVKSGKNVGLESYSKNGIVTGKNKPNAFKWRSMKCTDNRKSLVKSKYDNGNVTTEKQVEKRVNQTEGVNDIVHKMNKESSSVHP